MCFCPKRRETRQHFIQDRAEAPVVNRKVVFLTQQDFRCEVLRRAAERLGRRFLWVVKQLGQAEVSQYNMTIGAQQNVFWFEVTMMAPGKSSIESALCHKQNGVFLFHLPIKYSQPMKFLYAQEDLGSIQETSVARERIELGKLRGNVATHVVVEQQEQLVRILEGVMKAYQERMSDFGDLGQDITFHFRVHNFPPCNDSFFADHFQGQQLGGTVSLYQ